MTNLTPKQESFCLAYLETGNASEAYRRSYDVSRTSPKSINEGACKLLANTKIASRIQEIQGRILEKLVWEKQHSLQILAGIARDESARTTERIAAVKELNAMHGYNAPSQHRHHFVDEKGEPVTGINITVTAVKPGEVRITNS